MYPDGTGGAWRTGDWHVPGNLNYISRGVEAERNVILKTAVVRKFRSIENSGTVRFEPDVTCLVGKNESGKTAFLEALHQANPLAGPGRGFAALRGYPPPPPAAPFQPADADLEAVAQALGPDALVAKELPVERDYAGRQRLLVGD